MIPTLNWSYWRLYEGLNNRLRTLAGGRWSSYCRPTWISLLLTELCNARCLHCDIWKNRGKEDSPSVDQWKNLLSGLRDWLGPVHVIFTGGEALLKPSAVDLVAYGSSIGLIVELLSHGYWEDQSKIEGLALASPWRITISVDGIGKVHSMIRGRPDFFERTSRTLETLNRVRKERGLRYGILLKTVIMAHNLDGVCDVAHYARERGMEVFYQPIEQNYNTPEDLRWFETSENWPKSTGKAVAAVEQLIQLKLQGFPISNSLAQLEVMIPYFRDPERWQVSTQAHTAHERRFACAALGLLQVQANGDVRTCARKAPLGNFKVTPIRAIWENRPQWWQGGCCFDERCSETEKERLALASIQEPIRERT